MTRSDPLFSNANAVTSDLTFEAEGATLADVFAASAEALLAATVEQPDRVDPLESRVLEMTDRHADLLLLRFLNELIFLRDAEGLVLRPRDVSFSGDGEFRLRAELVGEALDRERHIPASEPKAATPHGLRVEPVARGWSATCTIDV